MKCILRDAGERPEYCRLLGKEILKGVFLGGALVCVCLFIWHTRLSEEERQAIRELSAYARIGEGEFQSALSKLKETFQSAYESTANAYGDSAPTAEDHTWSQSEYPDLVTAAILEIRDGALHVAQNESIPFKQYDDFPIDQRHGYTQRLLELSDDLPLIFPRLSGHSRFSTGRQENLSFTFFKKLDDRLKTAGDETRFFAAQFEATEIANCLSRLNFSQAPAGAVSLLCLVEDGVFGGVVGQSYLERNGTLDSALFAEFTAGTRLFTSRSRVFSTDRHIGAVVKLDPGGQNDKSSGLYIVSVMDSGKIEAHTADSLVILWILGLAGLVAIMLSGIRTYHSLMRELVVNLRTRDLLDASGDLIHIMDDRGRITYTNAKWRQIMRVDNPEEVDADWIDYVADESKTVAVSMMGAALTSPSRESNRERVVAHSCDGQKLYLEGTISCRTSLKGERELVCVLRDETKNVRLMADVQSQRDLLHHIINVNPCYIIIVDENGGLIEANRNACEFAGLDPFELTGASLTKSFDGLLSADERMVMLKEALSSMSDILKNEERVTTRSGEARWWNTRCCPISFREGDGVWLMFVSTDITDFKKATDDLLAHDKMVAVGTLAGGVAHEFKNFLAAIMMNAEYAKDLLESHEPYELAVESLKEISSACDKANEVALSLLSYSKRSVSKRSCEGLARLAQEVITIVESQATQREVEIVSKLDESVKSVVSAGRIQQALINVITNAIDAIEGSGVVTVIVRANGECAEIIVGDSGAGIKEQDIDKIFTPFYSTKGVWGKGDVGGTGLGLSLVKNTVEEHGGAVSMKSVPGGGTTVTLSLPLYRESPDDSAAVLPDWLKSVWILTKDLEPVNHISSCFQEFADLEIKVNSLGAEQEQFQPTAHDVVVLDGKYPGANTFHRAIERTQSAGALPIIVRHKNLLIYESQFTGIDIYDSMPDRRALLNDITTWSRRYSSY